MSLIAWIVVGLIAGFLAGRFVEHSGHGPVWNLVIGVTGGLLGGLVFHELGLPPAGGVDPWSVLVAFLGAVTVLSFKNFVFWAIWGTGKLGRGDAP